VGYENLVLNKNYSKQIEISRDVILFIAKNPSINKNFTKKSAEFFDVYRKLTKN